MDLTRKTLDEIDSAQEIESMKRIEAALFITGKFISLQELISLTDVNPILLKKLLSDLQDKTELDAYFSCCGDEYNATALENFLRKI